jgi:hypothetical protein
MSLAVISGRLDPPSLLQGSPKHLATFRIFSPHADVLKAPERIETRRGLESGLFFLINQGGKCRQKLSSTQRNFDPRRGHTTDDAR